MTIKAYSLFLCLPHFKNLLCWFILGISCPYPMFVSMEHSPTFETYNGNTHSLVV